MPNPNPNKDTRFKPGQSGNPGGMPVGARKALGEAFLKAVAKDFQQNGESALEKVRTEKPDKYLELVASILPKETNVSIEQTGTVTHEHVELPRVVERATELLQQRVDRASEAPVLN